MQVSPFPLHTHFPDTQHNAAVMYAKKNQVCEFPDKRLCIHGNQTPSLLWFCFPKVSNGFYDYYWPDCIVHFNCLGWKHCPLHHHEDYTAVMQRLTCASGGCSKAKPLHLDGGNLAHVF